MIQIRLKEILKEKNISMATLAQRMGVSRPSVSAAMKNNISTTTIEKIANALGVEPYELIASPEAVSRVRWERLGAAAQQQTVVCSDMRAVCPCCGKTICLRVSPMLQ